MPKVVSKGDGYILGVLGFYSQRNPGSAGSFSLCLEYTLWHMIYSIQVEGVGQ